MGQAANLRLATRKAGKERPQTVQRGRAQVARHDVDEIRHRLKNIIAVIQAIANATFVDDLPMATARSNFNQRLVALANVHDMLLSSKQGSADIGLVVQSVLEPYRPHRIRSRGPHLQLGPKPALAFALALHELGTNSVKYGALSVEKGYIDIAWTVKENSLRLRWRERNGPVVRRPNRKGFGSRLIGENLASEFSGRVDLDFRPDGLSCTISAPAQQLEAHKQ